MENQKQQHRFAVETHEAGTRYIDRYSGACAVHFQPDTDNSNVDTWAFFAGRASDFDAALDVAHELADFIRALK